MHQCNVITDQTLNVMFSQASSTDELRIGKWCNAMDAAWTHNNITMTTTSILHH